MSVRSILPLACCVLTGLASTCWSEASVYTSNGKTLIVDLAGRVSLTVPKGVDVPRQIRGLRYTGNKIDYLTPRGRDCKLTVEDVQFFIKIDGLGKYKEGAWIYNIKGAGRNLKYITGFERSTDVGLRYYFELDRGIRVFWYSGGIAPRVWTKYTLTGGPALLRSCGQGVKPN
jgi:hypothetical protein